MGTGIIKSKDVWHIIYRALEIMDDEIVKHGERTAYILRCMLQTEEKYTKKELFEYTVLGFLHDVGMIKTGYEGTITERETNNVWAHSIYGYLFLRYLSPIGEKAKVVLYHHLPYDKHDRIKSKYLKISEYLTLADKLDLFLKIEDYDSRRDYFKNNINHEISPDAVQLFNQAQLRYHFLEKIQDLSYQDEMADIFNHSILNEESKKAFLKMLIYAIDFRSQQTVFHTMATTIFAKELGQLMKVGERDLEAIYYGALLHDIGKIAIPINILEAPRRLSEKEMRIMKAHVIISEEILKGNICDEVLEISIRHHEKLDGMGYHRGLKEKDLTLLQRIVSVADILSALYGKRSYKEAFSTNEVIKILKKDADAGKICPEVVAITIYNMDKLIDAYEKQRENLIGIYSLILEQYDKIYEKFKIYDK